MKRADLLALVRKAADRAGLIATDRDVMLAKLSDPSVTRVAAGVWDYTSENCKCPAALAFGSRAALTYALVAFAEEFDLLNGLHGSMRVIEIED